MYGFPAGYIAGQFLTKTGNGTINPTLTPTQTPSRTPTRTPTTASGVSLPGDQVRTSATVNLRSGPGTNFGVLGVVPSNTNGVVTGSPTMAGGYTWYPVSMNGFPSGYLAGSYLVKTGSGPTITPSNTPTRTATVATFTPTRTSTPISGGFQLGEEIQVTTNLNLRSGPGSGNSSLGVMPSGTTGTVTGAPQLVGTVLWYPVDMVGYGEGWVSGTYLTNVITASLEATDTAIPTDSPTEIVIVEPTLEPVLEPSATATEVVIPPTDIPTEAPPAEEEATP